MRFGLGNHVRCCCCNIVTAAAICAVAQVLVAALLISNSASIYNNTDKWKEAADRYGYSDTSNRLQKWEEKTGLNYTAARKAFVEISLANNIAVHAVWLAFLAIFGFSFVYRNPVFAIPNVVMQILGLIWGIFMIGFLAGGLVEAIERKKDADKEHTSNDDEEAEYAFFATSLAFAVAFWVIELVFIVVNLRYYHFLKDQESMVAPTVSLPLPPHGKYPADDEMA